MTKFFLHSSRLLKNIFRRQNAASASTAGVDVAEARGSLKSDSKPELARFSWSSERWRGLFGLLFLACASAVNGFALDREAFTITNYDLTAQIDPQQHRLGMRGNITLRNDTTAPQKFVVLQISSSLAWRAITLAGKTGENAVQFLTQPYASDIDHTGALSEAIITLPEAVAPQASIELSIAYEGVIPLDATRLTRIGTPDDVANSSDWDRIGAGFTALRGAGYVAWYPIATESANLSEGDSLFSVLGRWKSREAGAQMRLRIGSLNLTQGSPARVFFNGIPCTDEKPEAKSAPTLALQCGSQILHFSAPTLLIADYQRLERPFVEVDYLPGHDVQAAHFADAAEKAEPLISDWFGAPREKARIADLPDAGAAPFEHGALLLTPLANNAAGLAGLSAAHQLAHSSFVSYRPWIEEGVAHFAQALYLERNKGRQAALDYMGLHRSAFSESDAGSTVSGGEDSRSLIRTTSEELYRSKAMCVWWMLRDMVGDAALKKALADYRAEDDTDPTYLQRLIEKASSHDLQWFFDDWVYHDRGLPDFKVESAFPRKTPAGSYIVTVTITNSGGAGAEVPITLKFAGGEAAQRLEVRARSKGVIRIEAAGTPTEVVVNDGSVPESDMANNVFKLTSSAGPQAEKP